MISRGALEIDRLRVVSPSTVVRGDAGGGGPTLSLELRLIDWYGTGAGSDCCGGGGCGGGCVDGGGGSNVPEPVKRG